MLKRTVFFVGMLLLAVGALAQRGTVITAGAITNGNIAVFRNRDTLIDSGIPFAAVSNAATRAELSLKADISLVGLLSNSVYQAVALKADASALSDTSNALVQAVALKADAATAATTSALATTSNTLAQAIAEIEPGSGYDTNAITTNLLIQADTAITLVISNGLVYAVLPNGDMVDVTYYLPAYAVTEPTTNYPAGFAAFDFVANTTNVSASAPQIAEWTRQNQPGDTMALTAENLDQTSIFAFSGANGNVYAGDIVLLDGQQCAVTLPDDLSNNQMYLMWPFNSDGFGEPVGINQTEMWWIGFDTVSTGDVFYAYGRNLLLGDGDCSLYIAELGRWLTSTTNSNPYRAEFTMPTDVANGTYTVYAHNGHGLKYGWSSSKTITVVSPVSWDGNTYDFVTDFGGNGSDGLDDQIAFHACRTACGSNPRSTVYIPAGTYHLSANFDFANNTRFIGAGMSNTIITATETRAAGRLVGSSSNYVMQDLTIQLTDSIDNDAAIYFGQTGVKCINVRFMDLGLSEEHGFIKASNGIRTQFENCIFISPQTVLFDGVDQIRFKNCKFRGVWDNNQLMTARSARGVDITGCTAGNYDESDSSSGFGWTKGRWVVDRGSCYDVYLGDNETINMAPRIPTPFWTNGVVTSYSIGETTSVSTLGNCKPCDLTFVDIPDELHGRGNNSGDWWGVLVYLPIDPNNENYTDDIITGYMKEMDATNNTATIWFKENRWPLLGRMSETSTVSAIMVDLVDQNSGEQYLIEGAFVKYTGSPSVATRTNITFSGASAIISLGTGNIKCAYITSGRGAGQARLIAEVVDNGGESATLNLTESWRVVPDESSVIALGRLALRNVFYNNTFGARATAFGTASAGVQSYGASHDMIIYGNTFTQIKSAVYLFAYDSRGTTLADAIHTLYNPNMFNHVANNTFSECYSSIVFSESSGSLTYPLINKTTFLGNVFRGNSSASNAYSFAKLGCISVFDDSLCKLNVFDGNTVSATVNAVMETGDIVNQVWIGNALSGSGGIGHSIASGHTPTLFGNTFTGFATNYAGAVPGGVLQIPQGTIPLANASTTISLYNVGTDGLTWTASDNAEWLDVTSSGSIAAESSGTMTLSRIDSTTNGATALVSVVGGGATNTFTVIYGDELGEP